MTHGQEPFDGIALAVFDATGQHMRCVRWFNEATRECSIDFANRADAWSWRRMVGDDRLLIDVVRDDVAWRWVAEVGYDDVRTDWLCYDIAEIGRVLDAYKHAARAWGCCSLIDGMARMHPARFGPFGDIDRDETIALIKRVRQLLRKPRAAAMRLDALGTTWYEDKPFGGPRLTSLPDVVALLRSLGHVIQVRTAAEIRMDDAA